MIALPDTVIGPLKAKVWLGILSVVLIIAGTIVVVAKNRDEKLVETGREAGASDATAKGHETTLDQARRANDAGNQVRDNRGDALYRGCLLDATAESRANCERFKPLSD